MVTRIGIDATSLPPQPVGAGNYIINLVRALASLDTEHEFVIFAQKSRRVLFDMPETLGLRWVLVSDKNPAVRLIWEQTFLPRLVLRTSVDLLHSLHYTRPLVLSCASVVTFHDMTFYLFPQYHTHARRIFFPFATRISAKLADAIIADSESTRQDTIRLLGTSPARIFTVPLGVDEKFRRVSNPSLLAEIREKYHLPEQFILYVGLVEPRKNLPVLVNAYKNILEEGSTHPLVIVGRFGWEYRKVLNRIISLNIEEKVRFTGYIPAQDLPIIYNLADIFVYPSIYEGFGLPPLEAMACGTPVISSAVSSLSEIIGEAGILVPPGDEQALTQAILDLLNDPELREELALKGLQRAANFTWKRTAQETLQVYRKVLQSR